MNIRKIKAAFKVKTIAVIMSVALMGTTVAVFLPTTTAKAAEQTLNERTVGVASVDIFSVDANEQITELSATTSNSAVLTVERIGTQQLRVSGVSNGTAVVTFYRQNTITQNIDIVKIPYRVGAGTTKASLTADVSVAVGAYDEGSTYYSVSDLYSTDSTIATPQFVGGKIRIYGIKTGTARITGKYRTTAFANDLTIELNVTVTNAATTATMTLLQGQQLAYDTTFYEATTPVSENSSIATATLINNKIYVTGVSSGTTIIRSNARLIYGGALTPVALTVNVGQGTTTQTTTNVEVGKSAALSAQTFSSFSSITSDNSAIATAFFENNQIKVTGVSAGQTNIKARVRIVATGIEQEMTFPVLVTASAQTQPTTPAEIVSESTGIDLGATKTLTVKISKNLKSIKTVKYNGNVINKASLLWVGSNDKVIQVNKNGTFKAVGKGKANLIALTKTGSQTAYVEIVVQ